MKRFLILLCAAILAIGAMPLGLAASAASNSDVAQKKAELESKYGITIQYPISSGGKEAVTVNSLITLDMALENVTPAIVRQVSRYYQEKTGARLTISYRRDSSKLYLGGWLDPAGFDPDQALIVLYLPESTSDVVNMTGENPITIVHEFGHAIHLMLCDLHGYDKMLREWSSYNNGIAYNPNHGVDSPDPTVFLSGYASSMFEEDAAITFGNALIRNRAGLGMTKYLVSNGGYTGLGKKIIYWQNLLQEYLSDTDQIVANLNKTFSTATSMSYQGRSFSGDYLQYMGYPQPRYILNGTLKSLGKQSESAIWLRSLGGWYVREPNGGEIIVFPGGVWCDTPKDFVAPQSMA